MTPREADGVMYAVRRLDPNRAARSPKLIRTRVILPAVEGRSNG
jgi:hypothetical protein